MSEQLYAPFSEDQVASLNSYQEAGSSHPFTCGTNDCRGKLRACREGWYCTGCNYQQGWAWRWMADWSWPGATLYGENDAFLRAIAAAPDADAPRLIYADWLEEHNDPRGEYLRLFVHLEALLARMAELCSQIDPHWVAAATRRALVFIRRAERIRAIEVRRGTVIMGQGGRLFEVIDRHLPVPGVGWGAFSLHLRDLEHDAVTVVQYHPSDEVQVVRLLSEFQWDDEAGGMNPSSSV